MAFELHVVATTCAAATILAVMRKRLRFSLWSPIVVMPTIYIAIGVLGYYYYSYSTSYIGSFYDLAVDQAALSASASVFFAASIAFLAGVAAYGSIFGRKWVRDAKRIVGPSHGIAEMGRGADFNLLAILSLCLPLLLICFGAGIDNVISRADYITTENSFIKTSGLLLSLPAVLALGYVMASSRRVGDSTLCIIIFFTYEIVFLSLSTRQIAIIFLFFVLGAAAGRRSKAKKTIWLLGLWALLLPFLMGIPLALRNMPEQGLFPLSYNLGTIIKESPIELYSDSLDKLVANLAFGVPLAAHVKNSYLPIGDEIATSLDPLPSFASTFGGRRWEEIKSDLRVNAFMPFNAIGELIVSGWVFLIVYYVLAGMAAAWIECSMLKQHGGYAKWGLMVSSGLLLLFSITSTQYNLRSSTRLIYYAAVMALACNHLALVTFKRRKPIRYPEMTRGTKSAVSGPLGRSARS